MNPPESETDAIEQYFETQAEKRGGLFITPDVTIEKSSDMPMGGAIRISSETLDSKTFSARDQLKYLWDTQHRTVRSRLMQSGIVPQIDFTGAEVTPNGIAIPCTLNSLTGKPITHMPDKMGIFRLFYINQKAQISDDQTLRDFVNQQLIMEHRGREYVRYLNLDNKDLLICLPASSENVLVPAAEEINLDKITCAVDRAQFDDVLKMQRRYVGGLHKGEFYITESLQTVSVPNNKALVIHEGLINAGRAPIIPHQPSPFIDPGFKGKIRFEHIKGNKEENIDDALEKQYVPLMTYSI